MEENFSTCFSCKSDNRLNAKFCRNCGVLIVSPLEAKKISPHRSVTRRVEDFDRPGLSLSKYVKEAVYFLGELRESYGMELTELKILLNYQKYLFNNSEKGIALIEKNMGSFIAANHKFQEITGYSEDELVRENFISLISKLNNQNKIYDPQNILAKPDFFIFNRDYEKIHVTLRSDSELFKNNSILVTIDTKTPQSKPFRKVRSATKKFFLVSRIAEEINRSLDIKVILDNTLETIMSATRSDVALVMFMDKERNLYPIAFRGISEELVEDLKSRTIKADTGTHAKALLLGKTIEAKLKNRKPSLTGSLAEKEKLQSVVTVPLKTKEEKIGVMSLGRRSSANYSGADLELLDAIINHVVIAINNSRLYEQVKFQLEELARKNIQLEELEQTKKKLTRAIVHDLKNPLTGIMAYSDFLQKNEKVKDKELIKILGIIYSSSQDIFRMVMNLLDISKMEEGKVELKITEVNPEEIINTILDEMEIKLSRKNLDVIQIIPEELTHIRADKNLFYRILINLIDNAIKYSRPDKKIEIEISLSEEKTEILFCVSDEGMGIPEEYRQEIFESFFSLDSEDAGISSSTGIGLAFCKSAVEAHSGNIWMEENITRGSRFCFTLPLK